MDPNFDLTPSGIMVANLSSGLMGNFSGEGKNMVESLFMDVSNRSYPGETTKPIWEMVVKTLFYLPVIVFAVIGNVIIIVIVARNKRMQTTTNYYIVNLAIADCLVALTCSWPHLADELSPFWPLGSFFCTFNTFSQVLCLVASMFTLTVIACDRFFGIVFAMKAHFIERRASVTIFFIWILSAAVAAPLLHFREYNELVWRDVVESWCEDNWPVVPVFDDETGQMFHTRPHRRFYYLFVCVALFFLPCLVMSIAYLIVMVTLWSAQVPGERISKDIKSQTKLRKRIIIMLVTLLAVFIVCWTPFIVCIMYAEFGHSGQQEVGSWLIHLNFFARYLAHSNSLINPFIYAGFNDSFKKEFRGLFGTVERRTSRYNTMVSRVDSFQSSTNMTKV